MMFIGGNFLLLLALLQSFAVYVVVTTLACQCSKQHPQKSYCENSYVLKITLIHKDDDKFMVTVDQVFKGNVLDLNLKNGIIHLTMLPNCDVGLEIGDTWIFFGTTNPTGRIFSVTCTGNKHMRTSIASRFFSLSHSYKKGCICEEKISRMDQSDCHWQHSFIEVQSGRCILTKFDDFERCKRQKTPKFSDRKSQRQIAYQNKPTPTLNNIRKLFQYIQP